MTCNSYSTRGQSFLGQPRCALPPWPAHNGVHQLYNQSSCLEHSSGRRLHGHAHSAQSIVAPANSPHANQQRSGCLTYSARKRQATEWHTPSHHCQRYHGQIHYSMTCTFTIRRPRSKYRSSCSMTLIGCTASVAAQCTRTRTAQDHTRRWTQACTSVHPANTHS